MVIERSRRKINNQYFEQGQENPPECNRHAVEDKACLFVHVAWTWQRNL